jgi:hypothetical protein
MNHEQFHSYLERLATCWEFGYCGLNEDWFGGDTLERVYQEIINLLR